ncbi:MAG: hypothetical protein ABSH03_23570 [Candidatus Lustribacter sp.]
MALSIATFFAMLAPVMAQDSLRGLAPADEYFGHYNLSVLGIANTIRDAGARIDGGTDPHAMFSGPLTFATDAIKDWEGKYPADPWIAKDLLALESVYLCVPTDEGFQLATQTESWLIADYPNSDQAAQGRSELAVNRIPYMPQQVQAAQASAPPPTPYQAYQPPSQPVYLPVYQPVYVPVYHSPAIPSYAIPWERYIAIRAPFAPRY